MSDGPPTMPPGDYLCAEVVEVARLAPHFARVGFAGGELDAFVSSGLADERIRIALPPLGEEVPPPPTLVDGVRTYPDATTRPPIRNYTVRHFDAVTRQITVDFVVHEGGIAAEWALRARPGNRVYLAAGQSWFRPPAGTEFFLLVADLAGLPALSRIVNELPDGVTAMALVERSDEGDEDVLPTHDRVTYHRVAAGDDAARSPTRSLPSAGPRRRRTCGAGARPRPPAQSGTTSDATGRSPPSRWMSSATGAPRRRSGSRGTSRSATRSRRCSEARSPRDAPTAKCSSSSTTRWSDAACDPHPTPLRNETHTNKE